MSTQGGLVSDGESADSISMSTLAVVYAGTDSAYTFEPFFGGHSAFECCLNWINSLSSVSYLLVLTDSCSEIAPNSGKYSTQISCYCAGISDEKKCSQIVLKQSSTAELLQTVSKFLIEHDCDQVLFAFGYCPFYDKALTEEQISELMENREKAIEGLQGYMVMASDKIISGENVWGKEQKEESTSSTE